MGNSNLINLLSACCQRVRHCVSLGLVIRRMRGKPLAGDTHHAAVTPLLGVQLCYSHFGCYSESPDGKPKQTKTKIAVFH